MKKIFSANFKCIATLPCEIFISKTSLRWGTHGHCLAKQSSLKNVRYTKKQAIVAFLQEKHMSRPAPKTVYAVAYLCYWYIGVTVSAFSVVIPVQLFTCIIVVIFLYFVEQINVM